MVHILDFLWKWGEIEHRVVSEERLSRKELSKGSSACCTTISDAWKVTTERKFKTSCNTARGNVWNCQLAGLKISKREHFSACPTAELTAIHTLSYQKVQMAFKKCKEIVKKGVDLTFFWRRQGLFSTLLLDSWQPSDGIHMDSVKHPASCYESCIVTSVTNLSGLKFCVFLVRYANCSSCTLFPIFFIIRFFKNWFE